MSTEHIAIEAPHASAGAWNTPATGCVSEASVLAFPGALHQVVSEAPVGYVQADAQGRITHVNRRWCEMLQYSEAEMLERSIQELTHPQDLPQALAAVQRMAQGGPNFCIDKRYLRRDGSTLWTTASVTALRNAQGVYQGLVAVVLDVSRRKAQELELQQLAQELTEADRCKSEFLATLAHELRNPLAPLAQVLHMLRLDPGNARTVQQSCDIMERQLRHLVRLVDELLDIARIARGKIALQPSVVELREVVQHALDMTAPLAKQHRHKVTVALPTKPVYLHADATRLAQVLGNLLNNAAKYTPEGGRIRVEARTQDAKVTLCVRDNGVGIAPEELPRIFDLFTQVGRSMNMAQGGLGIGLALSRQLVELHGGRISASSDGLGCGSVFTVELPTCTASRPPPPVTAALPHLPEVLRILVVDDNVDGANTMAQLLQMYGHQTMVAYDGTGALEQAVQFAPQVAFLDLSMPGMDGFELAHQLRQRSASIALVALTGWATDADRERSLAAGFSAHLSKPVDLNRLEATLEQLTRSERADGGPSRSQDLACAPTPVG